MALIECDDCKNKISDKATVCIHCGSPKLTVGAHSESFDITDRQTSPGAKDHKKEQIASNSKVGIYQFSGRRNRTSYLLYMIGILISLVVAFLLVIMPDTTGHNNLIAAALLLAELVAYFTLTGQRCRDFGWTGWACLITMLPVVGWVFALAVFFVPGNVEANRYGPTPR